MPISTTVSSLVKSEINHFERKRPKSKNTAYITRLKKMPFPAVLLTLSLSFSPRLLDRHAFMPMPVPTPIAIIIICTGKASVNA